MSGRDRFFFWKGLALFAVVAVATIGLQAIGLVGGDGRDAGSRLAAAVTLVGVLISASVSMCGILVKRQSERRLDAEHLDERERLRLDATMRAGSLFQPTEGAPADPASVASGLLALTQLDRANLAVALLVDLWVPEGDDKVSTETAIQVLNAALASSNPTAQLMAAELLLRNAPRLDACQSLHWPCVIEGRWNPGFGLRTKLLLFEALVRMTYTSNPDEESLRFVSLRLFGIWRDDPSPRVRGCVGRLLSAVMPAIEQLGYSDFMQDPQPVQLEELRTAASSAVVNTDGLLERTITSLSDELRQWSDRCSLSALGPGSLASCVNRRLEAAGRPSAGRGPIAARPS